MRCEGGGESKIVLIKANGNKDSKINLFVKSLKRCSSKDILMTLNIFCLIFIFVHIEALGLGPFTQDQQYAFLDTNSLNFLDLMRPMPSEISNYNYDRVKDRRLREFLINQCAPHILQEVFKPMSFSEIQTKGVCARLIFSKPMQTYATNNPEDPKWCLPVISLEQAILLMKIEYAKQQNQYIWLGKDWFLVFRSLPSLFYMRYAGIVLVYEESMNNLCVIL